MVWAEVSVVRRRINAKIATETVLLQTAIISILDSKKSKLLEKALKELRV